MIFDDDSVDKALGTWRVLGFYVFVTKTIRYEIF